LNNYLQLRKLPPGVLDLMSPLLPHSRRLKVVVACTLAQMDAQPDLQTELAKIICEGEMSVTEAMTLIKGRAFDAGQRVGRMAGSPKKDWHSLRAFAKRVAAQIDSYVDLPGERFGGMFASRSCEEVAALHQRLCKACELLVALRNAVGREAEKKGPEVGG
jgi:hypothetical protein